MSHSYRKDCRIKDHNKGQKRLANKKVSKNKNKFLQLKGGNYKKLYPQWDICDWNYRWTKEEAIAQWYEEEFEHYIGSDWRHERFKTLENWLKYWAKCVKYK